MSSLAPSQTLAELPPKASLQSTDTLDIPSFSKSVPIHRSLPFRQTLFGLGLIVLTVVIFAFVMTRYLNNRTLNDLKQRANAIATSIQSVVVEDLALNHEHEIVKKCQIIMVENPAIHYIIISLSNELTITLNQPANRIQIPDKKLQIPWSVNPLPVELQPFSNLNRDGIVIKNPFQSNHEECLHYVHPVTYMQVPLGTFHIGVSLEDYRASVRQMYEQTAFAALCALVVGISGAIFHNRNITRPISALNSFAHQVSRGNFTEEINIVRQDELGQLGKTMKAMAGNLVKSQSVMQNSMKEQAELREKDILLREIHHRVKNNMQVLASLIRIQCRGLNSETAKAVLKESETRIRSMALLHQKLYESESLSVIAFVDYVTVLVREIEALYHETSSRVSTTINVPDNLELELDTALPAGLIINELVSNAFKYAFEDTDEGTLHIEVTSYKEDQLKIIIADSGKGIDENIDLERPKSLGLRLVRMLSEQLDGDFNVKNDNGARFIVHLTPANYGDRVS